MRQCAELMNRNSGLTTFWVITLWTLNIAISIMYLCLLCKLKTVKDIFMKFFINVKHKKRLCRTQEQQLWLTYF